MSDPKSLAEKGQELLKEAVLAVMPVDKTMGGTEISRRAGIYGEKGIGGIGNGIVQGILNLLYEDGKVDKVNRGWVKLKEGEGRQEL